MGKERAAEDEAGDEQGAGHDAERLGAVGSCERRRSVSDAHIFVLPSLLMSRPNMSARRQSLRTRSGHRRHACDEDALFDLRDEEFGGKERYDAHSAQQNDMELLQLAPRLHQMPSVSAQPSQRRTLAAMMSVIAKGTSARSEAEPMAAQRAV